MTSYRGPRFHHFSSAVFHAARATPSSKSGAYVLAWKSSERRRAAAPGCSPVVTFVNRTSRISFASELDFIAYAILFASFFNASPCDGLPQTRMATFFVLSSSVAVSAANETTVNPSDLAACFAACAMGDDSADSPPHADDFAALVTLDAFDFAADDVLDVDDDESPPPHAPSANTIGSAAAVINFLTGFPPGNQRPKLRKR